MTRYKWPDEMGGGEHEEYRHASGGTEAPVGTVAFLVSGCIVAVARALLVEVKPPHFDEHPDGSVVQAGAHVFQRLDDYTPNEDRWYDTGATRGHTWFEVCTFGPPVLLAPAPEPVALPWHRTFTDGPTVKVARSTASNRAAYVEGWGHLTAAEAVEMGRALITAAGEYTP